MKNQLTKLQRDSGFLADYTVEAVKDLTLPFISSILTSHILIDASRSSMQLCREIYPGYRRYARIPRANWKCIDIDLPAFEYREYDILQFSRIYKSCYSAYFSKVKRKLKQVCNMEHSRLEVAMYDSSIEKKASIVQNFSLSALPEYFGYVKHDIRYPSASVCYCCDDLYALFYDEVEVYVSMRNYSVDVLPRYIIASHKTRMCYLYDHYKQDNSAFIFSMIRHYEIHQDIGKNVEKLATGDALTYSFSSTDNSFLCFPHPIIKNIDSYFSLHPGLNISIINIPTVRSEFILPILRDAFSTIYREAHLKLASLFV